MQVSRVRTERQKSATHERGAGSTLALPTPSLEDLQLVEIRASAPPLQTDSPSEQCRTSPLECVPIRTHPHAQNRHLAISDTVCVCVCVADRNRDCDRRVRTPSTARTPAGLQLQIQYRFCSVRPEGTSEWGGRARVLPLLHWPSTRQPTRLPSARAVLLESSRVRCRTS